jgi:hypothetical protein
MLLLFGSTEKSGVVYGVKLYPAGATTNSQDGVTDLFGNCYSVLEEMVEQGLPLLVICLLLILALFCFFILFNVSSPFYFVLWEKLYLMYLMCFMLYSAMPFLIEDS